MKYFILAVIVCVCCVSCGPSTKIVKSWREPNVSLKKDAPPNKTLVIALVKDEGSRRIIEDKLVKDIGTNASASYVIFTADMIKTLTAENFSAKLKEQQFNYVLLMRLADFEKETSYVPGTTTGYYGGYGRYYGYGAGMYTSPGYYTTDKNYFVETAVYSVEPDKLLWTGTTKTVNPTKLEKIITEISDVVAQKMRSDGFLK